MLVYVVASFNDRTGDYVAGTTITVSDAVGLPRCISGLFQLAGPLGAGGTVQYYSTLSLFPAEGTLGVVYIAGDTNLLYVWDGAAYQLGAETPAGEVFVFSSLGAFPSPGVLNTVYIAGDTNFVYYWDGSGYVKTGAVSAVLQFSSRGAFPPTGAVGNLYIATDTNTGWYWNTSTYVQVIGVAVGSVFVYATAGGFPVTGAFNTLYIAADTKKGYYWNGTAYTSMWVITSDLSSFLTLATLPADLAYLDHVQAFSKGQSGVFKALTSSGGSVAINLDDGNSFDHTLTENTTLAAASGTCLTGTPASESGIIYIKQHASAAKTFAFNTFWNFKTAFAMTTTLSAYSAFSYTTRPDGAAADCVQFL